MASPAVIDRAPSTSFAHPIPWLAFATLWLAVVVLPFERILAEATGGLFVRTVSIPALAASALHVLWRGRVRRPSIAVIAAMLYVAWSCLTMVWSIDPIATWGFLKLHLQLFALLALCWEHVRTPERWRSLGFGMVTGSYVAAIATVYEGFVEPAARGPSYDRIVAEGFDANQLAFNVVYAIPMAWYLASASRSRAVRLLCHLYPMVAVVAAMHTGSRAGFIAIFVALSIIPLTASRGRNFRRRLLVIALGTATVLAASALVRDSTTARLETIDDEIRTGSLSGRSAIWRTGIQLLPEHPIAGIGMAAFAERTRRIHISERHAAHNVLLSIGVERGVVGLLLFLIMFAALSGGLLRGARLERRVAAVMLATWFFSAMSSNNEASRVAWLIFSLVATCPGAYWAALGSTPSSVFTGGPRLAASSGDTVPANARSGAGTIAPDARG